MAEYIEREAAIAELKEYAVRAYDIDLDCPDQFAGSKPEERYCEGLYEALERITDAVPAADVVEVVHGRWLARARKNGVGKCCSACMEAFTFAPTEYCPNCGAKMDGGKDNATD